MSDTAFAVSVFKRLDDPHATLGEGSWASFVNALRTPKSHTIAKSDLPLWSPGVFADNYRNKKSVERAYALGFDVDEAPIPDADTLRADLDGVRFVAHTSPSSTKEQPRWRLVVALSRPVNAAEYDHVWSAVASGFSFPVGTASKDPSRQWFFPRQGEDGSYSVIENEGEPLDVDALLVVAPPTSTPAPKTTAPPTSTPAPKTTAPAVALLAAAWPAKGRHLAQRALAGGLVRDGWAEADAVNFLCDVCRGAGDEDRDKRSKTVADTIARAREGKTYEGWTSLESYVGAAVVSAARDLLRPWAEGHAQLKSELAAKVETTATTKCGFRPS